MKRIIKRILICLLITIILSTIIILNKKEDKVLENKAINKTNFISIMIENEDGIYKENTDMNLVNKGYIFNFEKSGCENGGTLVWNKEKEKIEASLLTSDKCYAYFDKYDFTKSCLYGYEDNLGCDLIKNKDNTLIYHDGKCDYEGEANCDLEAGDNNYRYAGTFEEVNNYVCFGSDDATCPEDYLYRIIGIFDGNIKLIKADIANSDLLGQEGSYGGTYNLNFSYNGTKSKCDSYCWQTNADGVCGSFVTRTVKDWKTSKLNTINLNTNFYGNFLEKWQNLIKENNFAISGCSDACKTEGNAKAAFKNEITESINISTNHIGLMYISDYMYAAKANNWSLPAASLNGSSLCEGTDCQDYQQAIDENWLYLGLDEWTITPMLITVNSVSALHILPSGYIWDNTSTSWFVVIRPVFYMNKEVKKFSGTGEKNNPYRITI